MRFQNRFDAGQRLAKKLKKYATSDVIVYALPRGGVPIAYTITQAYNFPLELIIPRKIGRPSQPEYSIAAVSEDGIVITNEKEVAHVDKQWFAEAVKQEQAEARRRREEYMSKKSMQSPTGKVAIVVDDGIATGLTMHAALLTLARCKPKEIIVASPIVAKDTIATLLEVATAVIALVTPEKFHGISSFYKEFPQVSDDEVKKLLQTS